MSKGKIYYMGFYDTDHERPQRDFSPAARNKMTYIVDKLVSLGYDVDIISASIAVSKERQGKNIMQISPSVRLLKFFSPGNKNKVMRYVAQKLVCIQLLFWAMFRLKKNDTVIIYHSLLYMELVKFLKKIKKFSFILEVEEIYSDVTGKKNQREKEIRIFQYADAYLFPSENLNTVVNVNGKPFAIIYGAYNLSDISADKFCDGKAHIVYAGTLDSRKGGAQAAVKASLYLDGGFHIHIIGFGDDKEVAGVQQLVDQSQKQTECLVTYDGCLYGDDYNIFMAKCEIGLSTQDPNGEFNDSSFPSKILSYMSSGLKVVSAKVSVVQNSLLDKDMFYYEEQTPEEIADAIMTAVSSGMSNGCSRIRELDESFEKDLKGLLKKIEEK